MTEQSVRLRRQWLYLPFLIAGVIMAAYFFLWRAGAAEMKKGVESWIADQRMAGMKIDHGALIAEGFPFFLRVHVEAPDIAQPGAWRWRGDRLTMDALPYDLNKLIFSFRGEQTVWLNGYGEWTISTEEFRTSIANDADREWLFAATIGGFTATRVEDGATAAVESLVLDLAPDAADQSTLTLNLAATRVISDVGKNAIAFDALNTIFAVTGSNAFSANDPANAWRSVDGKVQIKMLIVRMEDAELSVSGVLGLDAEDYPTGRLDAHLSAPGVFIEALGQAGVLTAEETEQAAAAMTLTAIAGGGAINAPIELMHGDAQIAGVKIYRLPRVN
ncbi:DUF2125 domain-containing protein [Hyphococcus sp.]|uniref:DUF2125 domain-containing protein n=1 Tax=Hyphococcus sp. TaxID=2038636 RepID=UPI003CCBFE47